MLSPHSRRGFVGRPRLRVILLIVLASITSYYLLFSGPSPRFSLVPYLPDQPGSQGTQPGSQAPLGDNSNDKNSKDEDDGSIQNGKPSAEGKQHDDSPKEGAKPPSDANKEQGNDEGEKEPEKPLNMDVETYNKEVEMLESWDLSIEDLRQWKDPSDKEDPNDVAPGYETDGKGRDAGTISRLQHEKDMRKMWRYAYKTTAK